MLIAGRERWINALWLIVFGLASSLWCISAARQLGATFDEPTYLQHGLHFWRTGSHRTLMQLGTMPLPIDVQTLPLAIAERVRGQTWDIDADFDRLLPWMRHGNLVFWWLLLVATFRIGQGLAGSWGGRLAVAALACEPNLLAHAALATTDIAITASVCWFAYFYRRGRDGPWSRRIGIPAFWHGIALLSKASAMVFIPLAMLAMELEIILSSDLPLRARWELGLVRLRPFLREFAAIALLGFVVALIGVGCDFQCEQSFIRTAQALPGGLGRTLTLWIAEHLPIFGNAGEGLVMQIKHNFRGHGQYLLGTSAKEPFWYYFPVLFAIKLTVPILVATMFVVLRPKALSGNWPLICAAIMLAFSLTCRVQIGIRLQLVAVVWLIVGLAAALANGRATTIRRCAIAAGIGWMAFNTANIWPNGLCYVNEIWGGTRGGYRLVSDSNFDWGQGLPELDAWNQSRGGLPLDVWYYGRDPRLKTMPVRDLPLHCVTLDKPDDVTRFCWGRYLAVSTSIRYGYAPRPAHRVAVKFLEQREPIARTTTFLIYDLTDVGPPASVAAASPRTEQ